MVTAVDRPPVTEATVSPPGGTFWLAKATDTCPGAHGLPRTAPRADHCGRRAAREHGRAAAAFCRCRDGTRRGRPRSQPGLLAARRGAPASPSSSPCPRLRDRKCSLTEDGGVGPTGRVTVESPGPGAGVKLQPFPPPTVAFVTGRRRGGGCETSSCLWSPGWPTSYWMTEGGVRPPRRVPALG